MESTPERPAATAPGAPAPLTAASGVPASGPLAAADASVAEPSVTEPSVTEPSAAEPLPAGELAAGATVPAPVIGIVGGGQLAWMLADAARELGVELLVQTPAADDPATRLAADVLLAPVDDVAATARLAGRCRAISFENEWIPLEALAALARAGVRFVPSLEALRPLVNKRDQRQLLEALHLPAPRWLPLARVLQPPSTDGGSGDAAAEQRPPAPAAPSSDAAPAPSSDRHAAANREAGNADASGIAGERATTAAAATGRPAGAPPPPQLPPPFRFPLMAKASSGGYDGKGTRPLASQDDLEALLAAVDPHDWILEEMVDFEQELAITACRDADGTVLCFPLVQTHQHQQVCDWVLFPAPVNQAVEALARNVVSSLLTELDYVGVLSIEFFYGPAGLQVNEIAPRTHNSGHLTIEACRTSQFAQQVRIVAGLPMGLTDPQLPGALMVNLLGFEAAAAGSDPYAERRRDLAALPGARLHWYGKTAIRPGRKLGHLTLALEGRSHSDRCREAAEMLAAVRAIWPLPPATAAAPLGSA